MKLTRTLSAAVLAVGIAAFGVNAAQAAEPLKIGLVLPMTGPFAAYGKQIEHGVKLYLEKNGDTIAGRKVQLIIKDDAPAPPATSASAWRRNWWSRTTWTSWPVSA